MFPEWERNQWLHDPEWRVGGLQAPWVNAPFLLLWHVVLFPVSYICMWVDYLGSGEFRREYSSRAHAASLAAI